MSISEFPYPFSAPVVPIADPVDGLLQTVDLGQPIPVEIVVWDAVRPGYFVQLKLDGELVGDIRTFTDTDKPGDVAVLKLNEKLLKANGRHEVLYQATNNGNNVTKDSPSISLITDSVAPGAALIAPIVIPQVTLGETFTVAIASYAGMETGDFIQTVCNGMKGPAHTVVDGELIDTPIRIIFEREFLQTLKSSSVLIEYFITDRAGNVSIMSLPVTLTIQA
jgi:hypothetical protein